MTLTVGLTSTKASLAAKPCFASASGSLKSISSSRNKAARTSVISMYAMLKPDGY